MDSRSTGIPGIGLRYRLSNLNGCEQPHLLDPARRPDVVRAWSDEQIARRWLHLFPKRRTTSGQPAEPNEIELNQILLDLQRLADLRVRLSDISSWMCCASENIARRANQEDQVTGHFWQGRFEAQPLLDEASLLAFAVYVDLNPIRAALAETPETSQFTGAKDRIDDLQAAQRSQGKSNQTNNNSEHRKQKRLTRTRQWERRSLARKQSWMSPLQIDERTDKVGADRCSSVRRASNKGFL